MAILDARALSGQLKDGKFSRCYYFYGTDTLGTEQNVKRVIKAVTGGEADSATKLDGANLNMSQLADEAELCPMFSDYNCIHIHDLNMDTLREDARKSILEIVKSLGEQTVLIFDVTGFDIYGGKTGKNKKPTDKNKKLTDLVSKLGTVVISEPKTPAQTASDIIASAKRRGCTMERPAAVLLADLCGCQSLRIRQEMGKLAAYADGGEITEQMVQEMVAPQLETTVYMLTNAVLRRRADDAMRAVDELLSLRVEMPYLIAAVAGSMIDVQRAAAARQAGKHEQDMAADFGYRYSFVVENAFRSAMGESTEHLACCLQLLCDAEKRLHSGAVEERVLFEQTIIRMLRS